MQNINLAPYKKTTSAIENKATSLVIKTKDQMTEASDVRFQIGEMEKKLKAEKEKITKPLNEALKNARDLFRPLEEILANAKEIIDGKMITFQTKQDEIAAKEQAKITQKVEAGKMDLDKAAEKMEETKVDKTYAGDTGGVQLRDNKVVEFGDPTRLSQTEIASLVSNGYLVWDEVKVRKVVLAGVAVPGTRIKIEKVVSKGRA